MQNWLSAVSPLLGYLRVNDEEWIHIIKLTCQTGIVSERLARQFRKHMKTIKQHASTITRAKSPLELDIPSFLECLKSSKDDFENRRTDIMMLQAMTQTIIEPCRGRLKDCTKELNDKSNDKEAIQRKIENAKEEASKLGCEKRSEEFERIGSEKNANANGTKRNVGAVLGPITTVGAVVAGFVLAPFTAGVSFLVGLAVAVPNALVQGGLTAHFHFEKEKYEETAERHRKNANKCQEIIENLKREIKKCETDIEKLSKEQDDLKRAIPTLQSFISKLYPASEGIGLVCSVLQDIMSNLQATTHQTQSFEIIQSAFSSNPSKLNREANRQMITLKEKWRQLQQVMETNEHHFISS